MYWNERTRQGMSGNYFPSKLFFLRIHLSEAMSAIDRFPLASLCSTWIKKKKKKEKTWIEWNVNELSFLVKKAQSIAVAVICAAGEALTVNVIWKSAQSERRRRRSYFEALSETLKGRTQKLNLRQRAAVLLTMAVTSPAWHWTCNAEPPTDSQTGLLMNVEKK